MEASIESDTSNSLSQKSKDSEEKSPEYIVNDDVSFDPQTPEEDPLGPQTPKYTPPDEVIVPKSPEESPPDQVFTPKTPNDTPPGEYKRSQWDPMIETVDPETGIIHIEPRFNKPEHGDIQYYYGLLDEDKQKEISELSQDMQVQVLKKMVNKIKTEYPISKNNSIIDQNNKLKEIDISEIVDEINNEDDEQENYELDKTASINKVKTALDKKQKKLQKNVELYSDVLDNAKIILDFNQIDKNVKNVIEEKLKNKYEKKCNVNGYVKNNTIRVVNFSSGALRSNKVEFTVIYQYKVCYPVEGSIIKCKVKNVTKAGIRAEINENNEPTPLVIFIARDHHNTNTEFVNIQENEDIEVKIIGKRFELNDTYISVIGELVSNEIV